MTVKEKQHTKYQKSCLPRELFSPHFYFYSVTLIFSFIPHSKRRKKKYQSSKGQGPRPPVVGDLFVFLIG